MTTSPPLSPRELPRTPAADVLAELTAVLAGMMDADARSIDAERSFALLGLDSLKGVEFLAAIGARYGIDIRPTALFEHPTPTALSHHVATRLGTSSWPAPALSPSRTLSPSPALPGGPAGRPAARDGDVLPVLRAQLARILRCAPADIDERAPFAVLGLDSILAAEFVAGINHTWALSEHSALLYEHRNLADMARYVTERVTGNVSDPVPAPALPAPATAPAIDLDFLLDAVRDDVLSVDEAAALLATRSA